MDPVFLHRFRGTLSVDKEAPVGFTAIRLNFALIRIPTHRCNRAIPDDDYLIALASAQRAALVSGDKHLLGFEGEIPVFSPRTFSGMLAGA